MYSGAPSSGPPGFDAPPAGGAPTPAQGYQPEFGPPAADGVPREGGGGMYGAAPATQARPGRRKMLIIGLVVAGVLVLLAAVGFVAMNALGSSNSFAVGSCVKQDGDEAKQVDCDEDGAFSVVSKASKKEECADQSQPFVLIERGGKTEVLCLAPAKKE
jgi:hypothetical protein